MYNELAHALPNLELGLSHHAIFLLVDWLAAVIAFLPVPDEDRSFTRLIRLQRFASRQVARTRGLCPGRLT